MENEYYPTNYSYIPQQLETELIDQFESERMNNIHQNLNRGYIKRLNKEYRRLNNKNITRDNKVTKQIGTGYGQRSIAFLV